MFAGTFFLQSVATFSLKLTRITFAVANFYLYENIFKVFGLVVGYFRAIHLQHTVCFQKSFMTFEMLCYLFIQSLLIRSVPQAAKKTHRRPTAMIHCWLHVLFLYGLHFITYQQTDLWHFQKGILSIEHYSSETISQTFPFHFCASFFSLVHFHFFSSVFYNGALFGSQHSIQSGLKPPLQLFKCC